jgi:hypothetical protein
MSKIDQLSTSQKEAYIKVTKFIKQGYNVTQAAKKAKVKPYTYHNALASLKRLNKECDLVTLTKEDTRRLLGFMTKAITTLRMKLNG